MTVPRTAIDVASSDFMSAANRLPTFYSLSSEFIHLIDLLESDPQLVDQTAIQEELQRLAGDIRVKAYGIAVVIQSLENLAELQANEAKRLAAKAKTNQSHADRLRAYALDVMKNTPGCERIEAGYFTLSVRQNPHSVVVLDASEVPSEFNRTKIIVETDKRAILDYFRATGEVLPGVSISRSERLEIR